MPQAHHSTRLQRTEPRHSFRIKSAAREEKEVGGTVIRGLRN